MCWSICSALHTIVVLHNNLFIYKHCTTDFTSVEAFCVFWSFRSVCSYTYCVQNCGITFVNDWTRDAQWISDKDNRGISLCRLELVGSVWPVDCCRIGVVRCKVVFSRSGNCFLLSFILLTHSGRYKSTRWYLSKYSSSFMICKRVASDARIGVTLSKIENQE